MHPLRLLSASLIASAFTLHVAAQSTPHRPTPQSPQIYAPQPAPFTFPVAPYIATPPFQALTTVPSSQVSFVFNAQNQTPCYTMRSYAFTTKDLQSPNPHASTYTECSPASTVSRKEVHTVIPTATVTTTQPTPSK